MAGKLANTGIGITLMGLVVGLPNLDTVIIDFSQFESLTITLMRLGLMTIAFYYLAKVID